MTSKGTTPSITTRFRKDPARMTYYTLMSALVALSTYLAVIFAAIAGHLATWPLLNTLSISTLTSNLGILALTIFLGALAWGTPYVIGYFTAAPFQASAPHDGLPKPQTWGIWALVPAVATLALIWFSPLWAVISPGFGGSLAASLPSGMGNNVYTYGFIVIPMAATYTLFTRDEFENTTNHSRISHSSTNRSNNSPSGSGDNSAPPASNSNNSSRNSPSTTSHSQQTSTSDSEDGSSAGENPLSGYTYNWQEPPELSFSDVGGMDTVKDELARGIISPLRGDTEKYEEFGVSIPNLLFHGPPGTGKTYMAEALAGELGYPYVKLSASDITSKWINESGDNINTLFTEAKELGNQYGYAVVFVDEIDALLSDRGMEQQHSENKKVVDEFLNHLSDTGSQNTLFIGATNHFESLDTAAIRSGRIDKKIHVGLPDLEARIGVFAAQLESRPGTVPPKDKLKTLAEQLDGVSSADIEGIVDRAARRAVERGANAVELEDLMKEVEAKRTR